MTVASLRFGATEPNGYDPGTFLMEQVSGWTFPLVDSHALPVSADLNYVQVSPPTVKPVVSIPAILTVKEGETLQIPVTKEGAGACTVQLRTIGVSAVTPTDYTGFLLPVAFGVNDTVVTVPLVTIADTEDDPDQTLKIELSLAGSTDCTLGNSNGIITITEPPRISVPTTASVKEGNVLSVIVTKLGSGACSVTWRTSSDTATVLSSDYTGVSATTLNFTSVETSKTITVQTLTDAFVEGNEFFYIFIENPVNCKVTDRLLQGHAHRCQQPGSAGPDCLHSGIGICLRRRLRARLSGLQGDQSGRQRYRLPAGLCLRLRTDGRVRGRWTNYPVNGYQAIPRISPSPGKPPRRRVSPFRKKNWSSRTAMFG